MKNNTTNTTIATTNTNTSEVCYVCNYKNIRKVDECIDTNMQVQYTKSVESVVSAYMFRVWGDITVKNILSGEEMVYNEQTIRAWFDTMTMDELANYHFRRVRYYGENYTIDEYYFTTMSQTDISDDGIAPLWKLEVVNRDTGKLIAKKCFFDINNLLEYADENLLDWRYPKAGMVNCAFYANGYDISKHFEAQNRKNFTVNVSQHYTSSLHVRTCVEEKQVSESGDTTYICSICGKEHTMASGKFNPWPVRDSYTADGSKNYCCTSCYEQYVSTMYKFMFTVTMFHGLDEKLNKYPENQEGYLKMLSNMPIEEIELIIEEEELRNNAMVGIRFLEELRAKDAKKRAKEEQRKERAKERARERRAAAKAAKLAAQENN